VIDWRLADTIARTVASTVPAPAGPYTDFADEVEAFAGESAERVAAYTGLGGAESVPAPETVDRSGWATTTPPPTTSPSQPASTPTQSKSGAKERKACVKKAKKKFKGKKNRKKRAKAIKRCKRIR